MSESNDLPPLAADPVTSPATPAPASRWEDFIDIFYAPSAVFARRATAGFGLPMLVVTVFLSVLFIVSYGALQSVMDGEFQRGAAASMRQNPQITPEMMQQSKAMAEKFSKIFIPIIMPVTLFLIGLVVWIVGKFFDAKETLNQAILIASYAYLPRVLEGVVNSVQGLLLSPEYLNGRFRLSLGVGRFFDPDVASPLLLAIVARLDVFTTWITVLIAIGLSVLGKIPRSRAAVAAAIVWILGTIPLVLPALRAQ